MKLKKENGITLVALIITIIVLIILSAIAIREMINQNLVQMTISSAEEYKVSEDRESIMLAINEALLEAISETEISLGEKFSYEEMPEKIKQILEKNKFKVEIELDGEEVIYNITTENKLSFRLILNRKTGKHELQSK